MSAKFLALAAVLGMASALPAVPQPAICPQGPGNVVVVNNTPNPIPFDVVREAGGCGDPTPSVMSGTIAPNGGSITAPMSEDQAGYVVKMAGAGGNPDAASGILQFEYTWSTANGGAVSYNWSDNNANPDPFQGFQRQITGANCPTITCAPGQADNTCTFPFGDPDHSQAVRQCPTHDGTVLTATIG